MKNASARRTWLWVSAMLLLLAAAASGLVAWLNVRGEAPVAQIAIAKATASPGQIERGAYLARAGNCIGCHTTAGGPKLAGGRGIETPFGAVYAPNITPDQATGIGDWSESEFWRAMHHGRAKDGRLLYPAFPYPSFTHVTREDSDALYAFLRSVPPVALANQPHALKFPYSTQAALAVWRALYFRPGEPAARALADAGAEAVVGALADAATDATRSAEWRRGKYLVQGLGHCAACHSGRNFLGGPSINTEFAGGLMPDAAWYAPSLSTPAEAGVQGWSREQVVALLKDGVAGHGSVSGPMAEVVFASTQHLSDADLGAMSAFLTAIPGTKPEAVAFERAPGDVLVRGERLYGQHCASCHGEQGEGVARIYPALAGNRAVTLLVPNNLVQAIRHGGFMPATAGNPRPFGMPPFGQVLTNDDIAAVGSYIRQSWGNAAPALSPLDVLRVE